MSDNFGAIMTLVVVAMVVALVAVYAHMDRASCKNLHCLKAYDAFGMPVGEACECLDAKDNR